MTKLRGAKKRLVFFLTFVLVFTSVFSYNTMGYAGGEGENSGETKVSVDVSWEALSGNPGAVSLKASADVAEGRDSPL